MAAMAAATTASTMAMAVVMVDTVAAVAMVGQAAGSLADPLASQAHQVPRQGRVAWLGPPEPGHQVRALAKVRQRHSPRRRRQARNTLMEHTMAQAATA